MPQQWLVHKRQSPVVIYDKNRTLSAHTVSWMTGVHVAYLFYEVIACLEAPCLDQWKYECILPRDLSTVAL